MWLHYFVLSSPRRGCRRYNWDRLPVERMLLWLEQVAAEILHDSHRNNRKRYTEVSYDMTRRNRSFGIY